LSFLVLAVTAAAPAQERRSVPDPAPAASPAPSPTPLPPPPLTAPLPGPSPTPAPGAAPAALPTPAPVATPLPTPPPRTGCDPAQGDICLNAEKQQQLEAGHFRAEGFVDLQAGTSRIQADTLDMYEAPGPDGRPTRRIVAQGNVVFMHGNERLSGDKLEMDLGTGKGLFERAHGFLSQGVLVEAEAIRRVDADTYQIEDATFTSCTQPNPRWRFSASSATLEMDDHIRAKNVVFRVKDVPAFYLPYLIYPIEDDQRSTGILFPHFGRSDTRGYNVGTGFFWAMNRSLDQTLYLDYFSKTGYGFGHELRYMRAQPSRGNFRSYLFRRTDLETEAWEYDLNWNAAQMLPARVRGTVDVQWSSNLGFQEEFQDNLDLASRRHRRSSASLQRGFGNLNIQAFADSTDTFFGAEEEFDRRRHVPSLIVNLSPKKIGRTGIVFGFESRAERLAIGNQDLVSTYSRYDLFPKISRPWSVSFLQLNPQVQFRATRYGASVVDDQIDDTAGISRRYLESSVELRGPTFSRVFENRSRFYTDRFKHVIGPEVTYTYRSKIDEFFDIPRFDYLDQIVGTNEIRYALVQRMYAKRPGASGKPEAYEFLRWDLAQTYYVDIAEGQNEFDPNYSSASYGEDGQPSHYSPVQSRLRVKPTQALTASWDFEYDTNLRLMRNWSLAATGSYQRGELVAGWNRAKRPAVDPAEREVTRDFLRGSARFGVVPNRLTLEGSVNYDLLAKNLVQMTGRFRYDVQCCGFLAEVIQTDYNERQERQFRFAIELANIGSIGNFMGPEAGGGFLGIR
jgi:lipopolysaccharide assembly outer membrane protein LptD (OstA)